MQSGMWKSFSAVSWCAGMCLCAHTSEGPWTFQPWMEHSIAEELHTNGHSTVMMFEKHFPFSLGIRIFQRRTKWLNQFCQ